MQIAIELLEEELKRINTPLKEDEDESLHSAVLSMRQSVELKVAIKVLKSVLTLNLDINQISWNWK